MRSLSPSGPQFSAATRYLPPPHSQRRRFPWQAAGLTSGEGRADRAGLPSEEEAGCGGRYGEDRAGGSPSLGVEEEWGELVGSESRGGERGLREGEGGGGRGHSAEGGSGVDGATGSVDGFADASATVRLCIDGGNSGRGTADCVPRGGDPCGDGRGAEAAAAAERRDGRTLGGGQLKRSRHGEREEGQEGDEGAVPFASDRGHAPPPGSASWGGLMTARGEGGGGGGGGADVGGKGSGGGCRSGSGSGASLLMALAMEGVEEVDLDDD